MVGKHQTGRNPVERVSWEDSNLWLPRHRLVLPTEAQWEYACRAGTDTPWITGRDVSELGKVGNIADAYLKANKGPDDWHYSEEVRDGHAVHSPGGSFASNAFGLFDVHGNVWEWCIDIYGEYSEGPQQDPLVLGGSALRVIRGGAWNSTAQHARSARRSGYDPDTRTFMLGVRPAAVVSSE